MQFDKLFDVPAIFYKILQEKIIKTSKNSSNHSMQCSQTHGEKVKLRIFLMNASTNFE